MSLRERNAAWWEHPGEPIAGFVAIWFMLFIFGSLFPVILTEVECVNCTSPAPTIGIFSLWQLLAVIAITLALVRYAISRYAPPTEDERG